MDILVFKTNLDNSNRIESIQALLDQHPGVKNWNVDLHDCDNVLRVVSSAIAGKDIEQLLSTAGYYCEELF